MKMALLEGPSLKQAEIIKQELGEGPGDLERGVRDLRSMLAASPHLPQPECFDTHLLELFVRGCRMDMDRARTKLEEFCVSRSRCRDLFEHRSLNEPPLQDVCKFIDIVPLPKLTDEGYRVTIFRLRAGYPESSADITNVVRALLLVCDTRMCDETLISGDVFIYEVSNARVSLTARVAGAINAVRRGIQLAQAAYPQRLKRVHIVGAAPVFTSSYQLMMKYINEKVRRRYHFHTHIDEVLDFVPTRIMPIEWGGEEESIEILTKKWRHHIDDRRDFVRKLNDIGNTIPDSINDVDIYGTVGAFRKLDID